MSKKPHRVFRDRPLTPEEVADDNRIREQVRAEFPPSRSPTSAHSSSFSELLKKSILASSQSINQIAADAGVSPTLVASFLSGERDIHMNTADKLASSLGLEVNAE